MLDARYTDKKVSDTVAINVVIVQEIRKISLGAAVAEASLFASKSLRERVFMLGGMQSSHPRMAARNQ